MYTFSQMNRILHFYAVYLYAFERNTILIILGVFFFPLLITTMYSYIIVLKLTYIYTVIYCNF